MTRVVTVLMGISSLVFYTLGARAPLVQSILSSIATPQIEKKLTHPPTGQAGLPHPKRADHHHLVLLLSGSRNRPRYRLEASPHHRAPQACPGHSR